MGDHDAVVAGSLPRKYTAPSEAFGNCSVRQRTTGHDVDPSADAALVLNGVVGLRSGSGLNGGGHD